jgi:hypothetical protein
MSLDDEVRAAAASVLERGGEHETAPLARLVLEELGDDATDKDAVDSVCKALQRWKLDGGPATASATKKNRFGKPLSVWAQGAGGAAARPSAAKPRAGTVAAVMAGADPAAFERIAAALELAAAAYAFSVGFKPEPPAAAPKPVAKTPKPVAPEPSELERLRARLAEVQEERKVGDDGRSVSMRYALKDEETMTAFMIRLLENPATDPEEIEERMAFFELKKSEWAATRRKEAKAPADYAAAV